jgi:hypothetical protein
MSAQAVAPIARNSFDARAAVARDGARFELRFRALFNPGRGYAFPCDAQGRVDLDTMSEAARNRYYYARALVGAEFHYPVQAIAGSTWT